MSASDDQRKAERSAHKARFDWMSALLACDVLTDGDKVVGIALALHQNIKSGRCDPSAALLAVETSRALRSVERNIAILKNNGFLSWSRPNRKGANRYRLLIPTDRSVSDCGDIPTALSALSKITTPTLQSVSRPFCHDTPSGGTPTDGTMADRLTCRPNNEENNETNKNLSEINPDIPIIEREKPSQISAHESQKIEELNLEIRRLNESFSYGLPELNTNRWHKELVGLLREGCTVDQMFVGYCKAAEYQKHSVPNYVAICIRDAQKSHLEQSRRDTK